MTKSFSPFDYRLAFMAPQRLSDMFHWHRHIPFSFALIQMLKPAVFVELGSYKGDSYSAMCQAVDALGYEARCYAVDNWQGDGHVGNYAELVFQDLSTYNTQHYGHFSTLVRADFDDALRHFADGEIDLLHIDGLHTEEAVRHDFETWLPKLSAKGVILFHDINVRERDFGVWKLWEELVQRFPHFEFAYGFGLGVLVVGEQPPENILALCELADADREMSVAFYGALGARVHHASQEAQLRREVAELGNQLVQANSSLSERDARLELLGQTIHQRDETLRQRDETLRQRDETLRQRDHQVEALSRELEHQSAQLREVFTSRSWTLTAPLRKLVRLLRRR
jgi:hypothetical protein